MTSLALLLAPLALAQPIAGTLDCTAIYRTVEPASKAIEKTSPMPLVFNAGGVAKYQLDFEGRFYSVIEEKDTGSLLGQIVVAPDYVKGTVSRGTIDYLGRFNLAEVDNVTVYRIECKQRLTNPTQLKF